MKPNNPKTFDEKRQFLNGPGAVVKPEWVPTVGEYIANYYANYGLDAPMRDHPYGYNQWVEKLSRAELDATLDQFGNGIPWLERRAGKAPFRGFWSTRLDVRHRLINQRRYRAALMTVWLGYKEATWWERCLAWWKQTKYRREHRRLARAGWRKA